MNSNNPNHAASLQLQKSFLINFRKNNPSQFKELAKMLRNFSKGKIAIDELYSRLSGESLYMFTICLYFIIFANSDLKPIYIYT